MTGRFTLVGLLVLALLAATASGQQRSAGAAELEAAIDVLLARSGRGAGGGTAPGTGASTPEARAAEAKAWIARLRAIDSRQLTPDEDIDRRFAETLFVGRAVQATPRTEGAGMGAAAYTTMLREQYLLPYDAQSLWDYAWKEFDGTVATLEALARRIDPSKTWLEIAGEVKKDHPPADRMIEAHQEVVDRAKRHLVEKDLLPIPWPERTTVVSRRQTPGNNPYYGNFSGATARPPAPDGTFLGEWHINPFDPAWDEARQREYLLEHDWGVILVTAPHETYGGHQVQILYQMHNPRRLRRANGTPMFSEGWGLYNEQLMQETGFFPDERIHLRQLQLRLWRNARVIYDCGMQTGRLTREEAIALMVDRVGFLRWAAEAEVESAIARPGYFIGYFMGMSEILKMREEYRAKVGAAFTLRDFHQRLLEIGSMPPALMRQALLR